MESEEIYAGVAEYLGARGYSFIVKQVAEELQNGRLREERLPTFSEPDQTYPQSVASLRRGTKAEFVRRVDYTADEALILLLEASRRAIVEPAAMAVQVADALSIAGIQAVEFLPERKEESGFIIDFDTSRAREAAAVVEKLDALIDQIRGS